MSGNRSAKLSNVGKKGGRTKAYNREATCKKETGTPSGHPSSSSSSSTSRPHLGKCGNCHKLRIIVNSGICHKCVDYWESKGVNTNVPGWRPF